MILLCLTYHHHLFYSLKVKFPSHPQEELSLWINFLLIIPQFGHCCWLQTTYLWSLTVCIWLVILLANPGLILFPLLGCLFIPNKTWAQHLDTRSLIFCWETCCYKWELCLCLFLLCEGIQYFIETEWLDLLLLLRCYILLCRNSSNWVWSKIIQKQKGIIHSITLLSADHMDTPSLIPVFTHINYGSISVAMGKKWHYKRLKAGVEYFSYLAEQLQEYLTSDMVLPSVQ